MPRLLSLTSIDMSLENNSYQKDESAEAVNQETREKLDTLKQEVQEVQTIWYFEKVAQEPRTGKMTGLIAMRNFGMKTVDSQIAAIETDEKFQESGDKEQIYAAYDLAQNQFDAELNLVNSQDLSPKEYGEAMNECLKRFEKNLESAAKTTNWLLNGTLAEKSEKDAKNNESKKREPSFQETLQQYIQEQEVERRKKLSEKINQEQEQEKLMTNTQMWGNIEIAFPGNSPTEKNDNLQI